MSILFSYTGTTPATEVTLNTAPKKSGVVAEKVWRSPSIRAGGGDVFIKDMAVDVMFHHIQANNLTATERTALYAFIVAVDGINKEFNYTDTLGAKWTARLWNAEEIRDSLIDHDRTNVSIGLLINSVLQRTISDTILLTDSLTTSITYNKPLADTITLSEGITLHPALRVEPADTINLTEGIAVHPALHVSPADTITLSDLRRIQSFIKNLSASIALSDSSYRELRKYKADSISLAEDMGLVLGTYYLTDEVPNNLTDESGNRITAEIQQSFYSKSFADTITLSDLLAFSSVSHITDESGNILTDQSSKRFWLE